MDDSSAAKVLRYSVRSLNSMHDTLSRIIDNLSSVMYDSADSSVDNRAFIDFSGIISEFESMQSTIRESTRYIADARILLKQQNGEETEDDI